MGFGGNRMKEQIIQFFVAPFFAFFLAHVLGSWVQFHMYKWRQTKTGAWEYDIQLAEELLSILNRKRLYDITDDLFTGYTSFRALHRLDDFSERRQHSDFFDGRVNKLFSECVEAINLLRKFTHSNYDTFGDLDSDRLRFHEPSRDEGGWQKKEKLLAEQNSLIHEVDHRFVAFHRGVAERLPAAIRRSRRVPDVPVGLADEQESQEETGA